MEQGLNMEPVASEEDIICPLTALPGLPDLLSYLGLCQCFVEIDGP